VADRRKVQLPSLVAPASGGAKPQGGRQATRPPVRLPLDTAQDG